MSLQHLSFLARFDVPPAQLWDVVTDHEGMSDWLDANISVVAGPGDGGLGTVRRIKVGPLAIDEEINYFDPPRRFVYRIIRGVPLRFHQGTVQVTPHGDDGSELSWEITIDSAVPGFAEAVAAAVGPAINRGLKKLRAQLG